MKNIIKKPFPFRPVLVTAIITAVLTWGVLYFSGFHAPHTATGGNAENLAGDAGKQLWTCGMHPWIISEEPGLCPICNMTLTPKRDDKTVASGSGERKIVYWRAPMNPVEIYDKPGKSAMGMDLIPVYEDELV